MGRTDVAISIAAVPAGPAGHDGMQRVVLSLTPVRREGCGLGKPFPISEWPEKVEQMLLGEGGGLLHGVDQASLADMGDTGNLSISASAIDRLPLAPRDIRLLPTARALWSDLRRPETGFEAWREARAADVRAVCRLWQKLMAPTGPQDWEALVDLLADQTYEKQLKTLEQKDDASRTPDVVSASRGRAAALLIEERACALRQRLAKAEGKTVEQVFDVKAALAAMGKPGGSSSVLNRERERARELARLAAKLESADGAALCKVYDNIVRALAEASRSRAVAT